ncbi:MAG: hypothetical protein QHG98_05930 [Methanothrix sp.]|uniref:COG1470 family protein n=1 Tax=Methanothrix sp. TaxID=90426 RepID=UPI00247C3249|nr:hypothetical protein [Methanothrix sp.]
MVQLIWILILALLLIPASATVEESPTGPPYAADSVYPSYPSSSFDVPSVPPTPIAPGKLVVSVQQTGPINERDKEYTTPGKTLDYIVNVRNEGYTNVTATITVSPETCGMDWFTWTSTEVFIPAGGEVSEPLQVTPPTNAMGGDYRFRVTATAPGAESSSYTEKFKVQGYDYASETMISGSGQFQLSKDVRSMNSGIKSNKDVYFSGSVEALVKNEYLVDRAKGRNPNFEEQDAVDDYVALAPGDTLMGSESFRSSIAFGGIGAKVRESYNLQAMEFKNQNFNLYQTGTLGRSAEFRTADNFTGYFMLDARQSKPGQRSMKEHEEYLGSFEIMRKILFRDQPLRRGCIGGACDFMDNINLRLKSS